MIHIATNIVLINIGAPSAIFREVTQVGFQVALEGSESKDQRGRLLYSGAFVIGGGGESTLKTASAGQVILGIDVIFAEDSSLESSHT